MNNEREVTFFNSESKTIEGPIVYNRGFFYVFKGKCANIYQKGCLELRDCGGCELARSDQRVGLEQALKVAFAHEDPKKFSGHLLSTSNLFTGVDTKLETKEKGLLFHMNHQAGRVELKIRI